MAKKDRLSREANLRIRTMLERLNLVALELQDYNGDAVGPVGAIRGKRNDRAVEHLDLATGHIYPDAFGDFPTHPSLAHPRGHWALLGPLAQRMSVLPFYDIRPLETISA